LPREPLITEAEYLTSWINKKSITLEEDRLRRPALNMDKISQDAIARSRAGDPYSLEIEDFASKGFGLV
jgi:hypothetical protein